MDILSKNIKPENYNNPVNLNLEISLSEEEKKQLIMNAYNKISEKGRKPNARSVAKALKEKRIGYGIVSRILMSEGLMTSRTNKKLHLETVRDIRRDFASMKDSLPKREKAKILAKKYGCSVLQSLNAINKKNDFRAQKDYDSRHEKILEVYEGLSKDKKMTKNNLVNAIASKLGYCDITIVKHLRAENLIAPLKPQKRKRDSISAGSSPDTETTYQNKRRKTG